MPRILVLTDTPGGGAETLLNEHVEPVHLEAGHAGDQLLERLAWAVHDAQRAERRPRLASQLEDADDRDDRRLRLRSGELPQRP